MRTRSSKNVMIIQLVTLFSLSVYSLLGQAAGGAESGLTAGDRSNSQKILEAKLKHLEARAKDFYERKARQEAYQRWVREQVDKYKAGKEAEKKAEKKALVEYRKWKAKQPKIDYGPYERAHEAQKKAEAAAYLRMQKRYSQQQEILRKALKQKGKKIPEDEEVGLNYDEI